MRDSRDSAIPRCQYNETIKNKDMITLLRENYLNAFSAPDKNAVNIDGGIALWDKPELIQNAFNPILFVRTKYLFRISGFEPDFTMKPNYVTFSGSTLYFDYALASSIAVFVEYTDNTDSVESVGAGRTFWTITSGKTVNKVTGIAFSSSDAESDYISDNQYYYVRHGYAFCNDTYMCDVYGDVMYRNTAVETYNLNIYKVDGTYQKLSVESYRGVAKFDAAAVVKSWLASDLREFPAGENIITDKALSVKYRANLGGTYYTFLAVNGVAQIGESSVRTDAGQVLTKFSRIHLYEGYDLDYAILCGASVINSERGVLSTLAVNRIRIDNSPVELLSEELIDTNIQDEQGNNIYVIPELDMPVHFHCKLRKPYYVRWINQLGGVDYFMFARQQKHTPAVKSVNTYEVYVDNPQSAKTNSKPYGMTTENNVTVGAEQLNETDFNALRWLAFARKIQHYDEKLGKWIDLCVSKFDGSYNTRNETHSVEVTFSLPNINIQY